MSDNSKIEWTDATWNPVRGCTKISPGCKHCYAETFAERFAIDILRRPCRGWKSKMGNWRVAYLGPRPQAVFRSRFAAKR